MASKKKNGKKQKSIVGKFIHSTPGQFIIGGLTVASIAHFGNSGINPAIAGLIGALPIGMPSSVFVDDSKVEGYAYNLMLMSIPLFLATILNWYLISHMKLDKYKSVSYSMVSFIVIGGLITFMTRKHK